MKIARNNFSRGFYFFIDVPKCLMKKYTKEVIRIRKSKKGRQYNGQKKKDKQRSTNDYTDN